MTREQFELVADNLRINKAIDRDYLFELLTYSLEGAKEVNETNILGKSIPINPISLLLYLVNELLFYLDNNKRKIEEIIDDDNANQVIASIALDKYFTNEHLNFKNEVGVSKYSPLVSTLSLYVNFVLGVLSHYKKRIPKETLLTDFLQKGFSMIKAIIELIIDGFETEAFSTWRTLHETECILILLTKHGEKIIEAYLRHLDYAMAYRGINLTKEQIDEIFVEIKDKMHNLGLKSKDMKKFIEYGWLSVIDGAIETEGFKYNFRDGVERLSGLSSYSKNYEMASEIAHSSPLLIYSKNEYFLHLVLLSLYESFFRLEHIFSNMYLKTISNEEAKRYLTMRKIYFSHLEFIYNREKIVFGSLQKED